MSTQARKPDARKGSLMPREHGAWGMLAQPFLGALIVASLRREWLSGHWMSAVLAAVAAMLVFVIREPLLIMARQQWVWREKRPETAEARRWAAVEALVLAAVGAWLAWLWGPALVAALGAGAVALTALAVYVTIRNRQRAVWFQGLSAAGLSASGLAACLAATGVIPAWGWWWWALHASHFLGGILVVHVRLEARIAAKRGPAMPESFFKARRETSLIVAAAGTAGIAMFASGWVWYGAAVIASSAWHFYNLFTAHRPEAVGMAMTSVGKRALAASIAFTVMVGAGALLSR